METPTPMPERTKDISALHNLPVKQHSFGVSVVTVMQEDA